MMPDLLLLLTRVTVIRLESEKPEFHFGFPSHSRGSFILGTATGMGRECPRLPGGQIPVLRMVVARQLVLLTVHHTF